MTMSLFGSPILLAVGTAAQYTAYNAYPTGAFYGQVAGFNVGGGFAGSMGSGSSGRFCRKGVSSEDLPGNFQQCFCDKFHHDEDPCEGVLDVSPAECRRDFPKYYDDVFDEDCVEPFPLQRPTSVRRCPSKIKTRDLQGQDVCLCDSDHVKEWDNDSRCKFVDIERRRNLLLPPLGETGHLDEPWAILFHFQEWDAERLDDYTDLESIEGGGGCDNDDDGNEPLQEELDAFDPDCFERFGGFGGYGGYQQQMYPPFGNNFYSTATMSTTGLPASTAAPVDGAAPAAPTFQYQRFPQYQQLNGGWGGYYNGGWGGNYNGGWGGNYGNPMGAYPVGNWGR